jgi:PTH1 family peptidyl-tRNA hydrolase
MNRFRVDISEILVIYDDFHIPFGTFRFRKKGSDGGHNGVNSIIYELGTEDFGRFRFGIGQTEDDTVSYVLSEFAQQETEDLKILLPKTREAIGCYLRRGMETTMNQYNRSFTDEGKYE